MGSPQNSYDSGIQVADCMHRFAVKFRNGLGRSHLAVQWTYCRVNEPVSLWTQGGLVVPFRIVSGGNYQASILLPSSFRIIFISVVLHLYSSFLSRHPFDCRRFPLVFYQVSEYLWLELAVDLFLLDSKLKENSSHFLHVRQAYFCSAPWSACYSSMAWLERILEIWQSRVNGNGCVVHHHLIHPCHLPSRRRISSCMLLRVY